MYQEPSPLPPHHGSGSRPCTEQDTSRVRRRHRRCGSGSSVLLSLPPVHATASEGTGAR